jgi:hypothetical protein
MAKVIEYRENLTFAGFRNLRNEGAVFGQIKLIGGRLVGQGEGWRWNTGSFSGSVGGT